MLQDPGVRAAIADIAHHTGTLERRYVNGLVADDELSRGYLERQRRIRDHLNPPSPTVQGALRAIAEDEAFVVGAGACAACRVAGMHDVDRRARSAALFAAARVAESVEEIMQILAAATESAETFVTEHEEQIALVAEALEFLGHLTDDELTLLLETDAESSESVG
jgi:hypothetical protein